MLQLIVINVMGSHHIKGQVVQTSGVKNIFTHRKNIAELCSSNKNCILI